MSCVVTVSTPICGLIHLTTMMLNQQTFQLPKQVASGIVAPGTAPTKPQPCAEKPFSYHDVRITKGNFTGYYAVITETGNFGDKDVKDEVEINYLKKSFSKWVVAEKDLDSRKIGEIIHVKATIDGRSRYTIFE